MEAGRWLQSAAVWGKKSETELGVGHIPNETIECLLFLDQNVGICSSLSK